MAILSKKRCLLLVGNGFSCGFVNHFGLQQHIDLINILPPPDWLNREQLPISGTGLQKGLWDPTRYPELHSEYSRLQSQGVGRADMFLELCRILSENAAFAVAGKKSLAFDNRSPAMQFRYYLWHLFRRYWLYIKEIAGNLFIEEYPWYDVLHSLCCAFDLTVVSYNYEFILESLLYEIARPGSKLAIKHPIVGCAELLRRRQAGDVVVLKPHGCISHTLPLGGGEGAGLFIVNGLKVNAPNGYRPDYELRNCPSLPDIVPPGHSEGHLGNLDTDVADATRAAFAQADYLVVCGFSGRGPDASELEGFLRCANKVCCVHVGLWKNRDHERSATAMLLRRYSRKYTFVDSSSVALIPFLM